MKRQGSIVILVVLVIIGILGSVALVADMGIIMAERGKLQYAMDSAVLAGIKDMTISTSQARTTIDQYLLVNGIDPTQVLVTIDTANKTIRLTGNANVNTFFARVLGITQVNVDGTSAAMYGVAGSAHSGLRPFGITDRYANYGQVITLKHKVGYHGNFGFVDFPGSSGAAAVKNYIQYGYNGTLKVGDVIDTQPGNIQSALKTADDFLASEPNNFPNYDVNSKRIWTVPVVSSISFNGKKSTTIVGFAVVFVDDVDKGNKSIDARFIEYISTGTIDTSATSYGAYVSKLIP